MTGPGSKKSWQENPGNLSFSMFLMLTDRLHMYTCMYNPQYTSLAA